MTPERVVDVTALTAAVWAALEEVRDPELDEPVTDLGFVAACEVDPDGTARIRLRLPTYFCAPNFAYLMVADARDAVNALPGISRTDVTLDDHFASDAINDGVAEQRGFVGTFGELAAAELDHLRTDFLRKAVLAATDRVCQPLLTTGCGATQLAQLTLGDVPACPERQRLQSRRTQLGLPAGDRDPLVVDPASGAAVSPPAMAMHLHKARLTRTSIEANGEICRGLLRERYAEVRTSRRRRSLTVHHEP